MMGIFHWDFVSLASNSKRVQKRNQSFETPFDHSGIYFHSDFLESFETLQTERESEGGP